MAATVPSGISEVKSLPVGDTWPWEFDGYQWAHGAKSFLDLSKTTRSASRGPEGGPEWREDDHEPISRLEPGDAEFAFRLRDALDMSSQRQLHVLVN